MWLKTHSKIYSDVKKEQVWQVWKDVNNYINWHDDLDLCELEGDFAVGNYFRLKPKGGPTFKVYITELVKNKRFVDCTYFFGAKMYDIHELEDTSEGLKITSTIKVTGILSFMWTQLVAKNVAQSAPKEMEETVKLAKEIHE
jgi:hypothetical protein